MPSTALADTIAANRASIQSSIGAVADHPVELIAVSKRQPDERIEAALERQAYDSCLTYLNQHADLG